MKAVIACLMLIAGNAFCEDPKTQAVRARVAEFCEIEFKGNHAKRVECFKSNIRNNNAVDFASEPVDLVNGYKIESVEIKGNAAKVVVEYDLICQLKNVRYSEYPGLKPKPGTWVDRADKLVVKRDHRYKQTIYLVFESTRSDWFVSSRQVPKVSIKSVLDLLYKSADEKRGILNKNKGESLPHIEANLNWDLNKIKQLEDLESLKQ